MRKSIGVYNLRVKKLEAEAGERVVDRVMVKETISEKELNIYLKECLKGYLIYGKKGYEEGRKFGKYLGGKIKRKKKSGSGEEGLMERKRIIEINLFNEELKKIFLEWIKGIREKMIKLRMRGINDFSKEVHLVLEFNMLKNRVKREGANFINRMAQVGYFKGLVEGMRDED